MRSIKRYYGVKRALLLLIASLFSLSLSAQIEMRAEAPKVVERGEDFRLVFTINGLADSFIPPTIVGLKVLAGPSTSTVNSTQIVNGRRSERIERSYTYVLSGEKEGKFTIPSASAEVDGKRYSSQPITIEVVKGGERGEERSEEQRSGALSIGDDDLFLRVTLNKSRVMSGEPLVATLKLYTRVPITGFEDIRFPSFNGFWSEEIDAPQNIEFVRESVDGKVYDAALLRRYKLTPQQSGELLIEGAEMVCQVRVRGSSEGRSLFDSFFDLYETVKKRIRAPGQRVVVSPLPAGAPPSFSGAVGKFFIESSLSADSVDVNEALSYQIEISGSGNIEMIETPKPSIPNAFEQYESRGSEGRRGAHSYRRFEFPLIARAPGEYTIEPLQFSYYDIEKREYVTLSTAEKSIKVSSLFASTTDEVTGQRRGGIAQQSVKSIADDIRFIALKGGVIRGERLHFFGSFVYYLLLTLMVVLLFVADRLILFGKRRRSDQVGGRSRRANRVAKRRLKEAELLLKGGERESFYGELYNALSGYLIDKLNLSISDLSNNKIREYLLEKSVAEEEIEQLLYLIERCDYVRYSPEVEELAMESDYNLAIKLISSLEL